MSLVLCGTFATGTLDPGEHPAGQQWVDEYKRVRLSARTGAKGARSRVRAERRQRAGSDRARHLRALGREPVQMVRMLFEMLAETDVTGSAAQHPRADAGAPPRRGVHTGRARAPPGRAHPGRTAGRAAGCGPHPLLRRRGRLRRGDRGVPDRRPARAPIRSRAHDRDVHRHRRLHGARGGARGCALA